MNGLGTPCDQFGLIAQLRALLREIEVRGPANGRRLDLVDRGLAELDAGLRKEKEAREERSHADDHNG